MMMVETVTLVERVEELDTLQNPRIRSRFIRFPQTPTLSGVRSQISDLKKLFLAGLSGDTKAVK